MYIFTHLVSAQITNGLAMVTVGELACGVTYTITAGGTLDGQLVGPRSSHGTVTAGPCEVVPTTTTSVATTSMTGKKIIICRANSAAYACYTSTV